MPTFTIKAVMPSGKANPQFGQEFYVQFNEMSESSALWFKEAPEIGKELELEKNERGQWKKVKKEWNPNQAPAKGETAARPAYKDNSDGMRQGMAINNAANYVNSLTFEKALTDREWAETVISYAKALYTISDLNKDGEPTDVPKDVAEAFGVK